MNGAALAPCATDSPSGLQALRERHRARKNALLDSLQGLGSSARGIRRLLQDLAREADDTLKAVWQAAGLPPGFALLGVGGFGRGELFP
ncbi:MAG TPA: hypothetical protein VKP68_16160, partial [Ramlibacter sp.]|nr:hypothetical protein [Ramlibacter sp.]